MKNRFALLAAIAAGIFGLTIANVDAQSKAKAKAKPQAKAPAKPSGVRPSGAETGLVGIRLYDTGLKVVQVYGSPDEISTVGAGGGSIGPVGGGGGGGLGAPGGRGFGGGGGAGASQSAAQSNFPGGVGTFDFGDQILRSQGGMTPSVSGASDVGGQQGGGEGGGQGMSAAGGGGGGGQQASTARFTRWVYNRSSSKYAFVIDKFNRVVQIEAIGITDSRVRTGRGLGFGSSFSKIIKTYGAPDGYDISGNNLVVRYLQNRKVAFRLSRLGKNKTHTVTGVVVAGGKA